MAQRFNAERAARILSDAIDTTDVLAATKHGVTTRTIENYRVRLETDPSFAALVSKLRKASETQWQGERILALRTTMSKMVELVKGAETIADLPAVTQAARVLGELQIASEALDVSDIDDRESSPSPETAADGEAGSPTAPIH